MPTRTPSTLSATRCQPWPRHRHSAEEDRQSPRSIQYSQWTCLAGRHHGESSTRKQECSPQMNSQNFLEAFDCLLGSWNMGTTNTGIVYQNVQTSKLLNRSNVKRTFASFATSQPYATWSAPSSSARSLAFSSLRSINATR